MKKEYVVEILILIFLFICTSMILYWAYKVHYVQKHTHTLYFKDVDGIVVGSPVRFMGVVVGHVNNLEYKNGSINVKILITKRGIHFPKGTTANVQFTGLAGSKSIEIIPPSSDSVPYDIIMTENPLRVKDIFDYSKSFTNALLSIENQMELVSSESIYKIIQRTTVPYEWTNIDNMLDKTTQQFQNRQQGVHKIINAEKALTDKINKINNSILKNN